MEPAERVRINKLPPGMSPDKVPPGVATRGDPQTAGAASSPRTQRPASAAAPRPGTAALRASVRVANEQMAASMAAIESLETGAPDAGEKVAAASPPRSPRVGMGTAAGGVGGGREGVGGASRRSLSVARLDDGRSFGAVQGGEEPSFGVEGGEGAGQKDDKASMEAKVSWRDSCVGVPPQRACTFAVCHSSAGAWCGWQRR